MRTVRSFIAARAAGLGALMLVSASGAFPAEAQAAVAGETRDLAESMNKLGGAVLGSLAGNRNSETVVVSPYGPPVPPCICSPSAPATGRSRPCAPSCCRPASSRCSTWKA